MIGTHLRQYHVTASLGRGGMGEVWLATDTTLGRRVAIKTLPAAADDADAATRKERFFREARAASALNHPNIITIYEINSDRDVDFIAMEYVEGRTLADLLEPGPLPIAEVRRIAQQVAEAVAVAHRAGIVHRDLKPRNIMVSRDGLVKVLDFGLAKLTDPGDADTANAKTRMALTRVGTTVGTLGYMSPEQAIGDPVDARSDVFSFGVILYEMLTGRLPFAGESMSEILRQLHFAEPPPLETVRADTPAALRVVVAKSLRKNPDERFADMTEAADALNRRSATVEATAPIAATPTAAPPNVRTASRAGFIAAAALLVVLLAVVAGIAFNRSRTPPASPPPAPIVETASPAPQPKAPTPPAAASAAADTAIPPVVDRPATRAAVPDVMGVSRTGGAALTHVHWGVLGDAHRAEPGREFDAAAAYRRAIELVDRQLAGTPGDAGLESWRALYLAKLGDRQAAVAAIEPLTSRQDLAADVWFRMGVAYEVSGVRQRALMSLSRAVSAGHPVRDIATEPALAELRSDPRFQRLAKAAPARKRPRQ